jgi:hypothetical protein
MDIADFVMSLIDLASSNQVFHCVENIAHSTMLN